MKKTIRIRRAAALAVAALPFLYLAQGCSDDDTAPTPTGAASSSSSSSGDTGGGGASSSSSSSSSSGMGGAGVGGAGVGGAGVGGAGGAGVGGAGGAAPAAPDLDPNLMWHGTNRADLDAMIDAHGVNSATYDPAKKPVAVFDWDNTVIKNDVGDLTTFWLIKNNKILQPANKNWGLTSPFLTAAAKAALNAACDAGVAAGQPLQTSTNTACADEIYSIYFNGTTKVGAMAAFSGWNYRQIEPAYAWAAQLTAGYTPAELSGFATTAIDAGLAAAEGDVQTIGTTANANAYVRIYEQIMDLIGVLQKNGFDVWVVSASPQSFVEPFAAKVNIAADHVIGIRMVADAGGKLTANIQGCGPVPDGTNDGAGNYTGNSLITYIDGKRCWINKIIYGDNTAAAISQNADKTKRIVFGAGDSDTDISFLRDATGLKLAINRNKKELMCNAYGNYMGTWLINPMFILPKAQQMSNYPCSTTACKDMNGASVPCLDEGGQVIPDQADSVF